MDIVELIHHPEQLDRETLYELRSMLALYPYYQTARLLMLKNLYLLHDTSFDEELRRAAVYITDRKVIFQMVEAAHYKLHVTKAEKDTANAEERDMRTISLIDTFLESIPKEEPKDDKQKRKPTPADAAVDYVAYLLESENDKGQRDNMPQLNRQDLIDSFINGDKRKIVLNEEPELKPELETVPAKEADDGYYTETLARIYIKQGSYKKALDILQRLDAQPANKNAYFADQIRFLEKLIINNNKIKK